MNDLKRTPVFQEYEKWGAKTIDFGGWDMPVSFSGIMKEHQAVREHAGLFDVSHMGEIMVEGKGSLQFVQKITTNNVENLTPGKAQYTFMCNENGGTIDDFLIYMLDENKYMLVVNAANIEKDFSWISSHIEGEDVKIHNHSDECALLAVQGPNAPAILQKVTETDILTIKPFRFQSEVSIKGIKHPALISRTGYTGEDGFEIYIHNDSAVELWQLLLETGKEQGIIPAGLGARDTLRFEAGLPLYGQELSETISPVEAGLTFAVKLNKAVPFIGQEALQAKMETGPELTLVGLELMDKGIARTGHEVFNEAGETIGTVTTGTKSPTLNKAIAFALIDANHAKEGEHVMIQVRRKQLKAIVVPTPFYKRK